MGIKNNKLDNCLPITCNAKASTQKDGPPKLSFQGYSGDTVDLADYGFEHPVVYNISTTVTKQTIPIKFNHNETIGHSTSVRKVDHASAIRGKGLASLPGPTTDKIIAGIHNGFPWQASMGLHIVNWQKDIKLHDKGTVTVNQRTFSGPLYVVDNAVLREMTITEEGRDSDTSFEFLNQEKRMQIKNATGTPPAPEPIVENTVPVPAPAPIVEPAPAPAPAPIVENTVPTPHEEGLDPLTRRSMALLNKYPGNWELIEKGLDNKWDDEAIENSIKLEALNSRLPVPPSPGMKKGDELQNELQARMCLSFGSTPEYLEKKMPKAVVENAHNLPQMGIVELLLNVANSSGGNFTGLSDIEQMCKHITNTGYSTFDLPDFFEKVASTLKDERWELNPPFAPSICKEGSNKDFRKTERARITGGDIWNPVAHDGKLELYASGKQKKYQTELDTYGALFAITRKDAINDDMGALSDLMDAMVEGATIIPDYQLGLKMLTQLPSAGTFWVDDDNSFDNTALTRANLSTAYNSVRQYLENKERMDWNVMLNDRWSLIVSPNLEEAAWDIIKQDRIVNDTTANTKTGDKNYWFGRMDIKVFGQMANTSAFGSGKFTGNTTWILWPSSLRFSPYEITYLRGQKRPVIETVDLPATLLGFATRGYWDVNINERERTAVQRYTATA